MSDIQNPSENGPSIPDDSAAWALAERICWHLMEKKAEDIVVLDLRGRSDVCDFFVVASGHTTTQVQALARHIHNQLAGTGQKPKGIEGQDEGRWALLDYFDVVVHIFVEKAREYFQLERLWADSARLDVEPEWFRDAEVRARHPQLNFTTAADLGPDGNGPVTTG
ncbi:ribosome silencing factor [bacterium DOLZORAL124_64_63]|nr:MAG: ribosome silencing factor [bacterium DOLZORAL124_64_63]